ncbi:hypothetical protein ACFP3I_15215 [Chryseobacterium arachidis]
MKSKTFMIRKNFIGLYLLAGLAALSCNKNESKTKISIKDSSVVAQSEKPVSESSQKENDQKPDNEVADSTNTDKPKTAVSKKSIEGKYVATTCDGGRFSMEFKNVDGKPTFKIYDKSKIIAAGNVSTETDEKTGEISSVTIGEIGGLYEGDKIVIQNYGNAMNEFEHFTQCGDKYLEFSKR